MIGKISRLPHAIREELNRRLADAEPHHQLLACQEALEDEFWEWTKRPHIREKLNIERDKTQLWHDALRAVAPEIAPFLPPLKPAAKQPDQTLTPAALISPAVKPGKT